MNPATSQPDALGRTRTVEPVRMVASGTGRGCVRSTPRPNPDAILRGSSVRPEISKRPDARRPTQKTKVTSKATRRYILILEAPSWADEAGAVRLLRAMLKRLARGYGLRCVEARPAVPTQHRQSTDDYAYPFGPTELQPGISLNT